MAHRARGSRLLVPRSCPNARSAVYDGTTPCGLRCLREAAICRDAFDCRDHRPIEGASAEEAVDASRASFYRRRKQLQ